MAIQSGRRITAGLLAALAIVFGLATIRSGGAVALNLGGAREAAGAYIPLIVWFNTLAGFFYVAAGAGLWLRRGWAARLAVVIALATALVLAVFLGMIALGVPFEVRTLAAMVFRLLVWAALALYMRAALKGEPA